MGSKSAYNAYRLDNIIKEHNERLFQTTDNNGTKINDTGLDRNKTLNK